NAVGGGRIGARPKGVGGQAARRAEVLKEGEGAVSIVCHHNVLPSVSVEVGHADVARVITCGEACGGRKGVGGKGARNREIAAEQELIGDAVTYQNIELPIAIKVGDFNGDGVVAGRSQSQRQIEGWGKPV